MIQLPAIRHPNFWKRFSCALLAVAASLLLATPPAIAQSKLAQTKHNLTPTGPGPFRETAASGLCVFCHTPHKAAATRGLWNHNLPGQTYTLYESSTLQSRPGQPTGSSRMCLSCHDGVLALSSVRMPTPGSTFTLGQLTGSSDLGTNLSDDHPISFVYDSSLAARQGELSDPATLPHPTPLDEHQELQCDTCHDPHEDVNPDFLRVTNRFGELCTTCHRPALWNDSVHATSTATWQGNGANPWPADAFPSVAENACLNCHRPHAAGHAEWLLAHSQEPDNCNTCHDGSMTQTDIASEFAKPFHHPIETGQWTHQPKEDPLTMADHVTCDDCHDPHAAAETPSGTAQTVAGSQRHVTGVTIAGVTINTAVYKYEICLKCHGEREPLTAGITRADGTRNIRLRIDPANPSYHPIAAPGKNSTITGLDPQYTAASQIDCIDCHDNDGWTDGGVQPRGPHGSNYAFILARQYQAGDPVAGSYDSYALCYGCHDPGALMQPGSGFPHNTHVQDYQASCSACHDPHGSRSSPFLVDFMTRTQEGAEVVTPSASGRLEFIPDPAGPGHGTCYLSCHGHEHDPSSY